LSFHHQLWGQGSNEDTKKSGLFLLSTAVVRISTDDKSQETIAAAFSRTPNNAPLASLNTPASLAFGTRKGGRQILYVTNLGMYGKPGLTKSGPELPVSRFSRRKSPGGEYGHIHKWGTLNVKLDERPRFTVDSTRYTLNTDGHQRFLYFATIEFSKRRMEMRMIG
jgi:hypothetical protein